MEEKTKTSEDKNNWSSTTDLKQPAISLLFMFKKNLLRAYKRNNTTMSIRWSGEDKTTEEDFTDRMMIVDRFFGDKEKTRELAKEESDKKVCKELLKMIEKKE